MGKRIALDIHNNIPNKKKKKNYQATVVCQKSATEESSSCSSDDDESNTEKIVNNYKESPKPEFQLSQDVVNGAILTDISQKDWRIGSPIGKGSFGEIFLAADDILKPVSDENAKYVAKIEPHSNGPLFVEIHCLLNTAKFTEDQELPPGMPEYIASGSHYFRNVRYRFLILPRFDRDLHSIIKNRRLDEKSVLILAVQILDTLQHIHSKGYCHSDIKAENLMIGKCSYTRHINAVQQKQNKNSIEKDYSDHDNNDSEDSDFEHVSEEGCSDFNYKTPMNKKKLSIQYSGSNPVRACRSNRQPNSIYQEMINSHYLRPAKKINYSAFFNDENSKGSFTDDECTIDDYISNHRLNKSAKKLKSHASQQNDSSMKTNNDSINEESQIYLIDFGLASKFEDCNGVHRPFCMDQRRAHDGTLEFTSRDAHMGAHSRRSDLECLGYNLIFWSQGYLPWKEKAAQQQHEKVHWMKEYLMTDVRGMLKHIYGKKVPKFLGEFMHHVGKLAYDERPDYIKFRNLFQHELFKLGVKSTNIKLNIKEMIDNSLDVNDEIENNNFTEMKNIKSIMKNLGVLMPFRESNSNRVSPKNLRSKSGKNSSTKKKKKFSWAEILSQNPDQIARERAEKEYEREKTLETPVTRYQGKPTYAILEIQSRIKLKDRLDLYDDEENDQSEFNIKGYTKPMMEILKKRQHTLFAEIESKKNLTVLPAKTEIGSPANHMPTKRYIKKNGKEITKRTRTKEGLRTIITPTKRAIDYNNAIDIQKTKRKQNLFIKKSAAANALNHRNNVMSMPTNNFVVIETDESSSCSINSIASSSNNNSRSSRTSSKKSSASSISNNNNNNNRNKIREICRYAETSNGNSNSSISVDCASSSTFPASLSDEDTRDVMVVFNPKRTRHAVNKLKIKINGNKATIVKNVPASTQQVLSNGRLSQQQQTLHREGVNRRKKSVPKKRNHKGEIMRCV